MGLDKAAWRKRMTAVRDAVSCEKRIEWSERLCLNVEREVLSPLRSRLDRPLNVCVYAPIRSEADPLPLAVRCWAHGDTVCAPRIWGGNMELRVVRNASDWQPGKWGVPEPDPSATSVLPDDRPPDVVLVPGIAFHAGGRSRLGYGGGYYDRFFAAGRKRGNKRIQWVGFALSVQLVDEPLPSEAHDLILDVLATEKEVIRLHGGGQ